MFKKAQDKHRITDVRSDADKKPQFRKYTTFYSSLKTGSSSHVIYNLTIADVL